MKPNMPLIIGIRSHVVALDPSTGTELWRTKLKSGQFVTTYVRDANVFAGVSGGLFCVDRMTGKLMWHNKLKRLGFGIVSFAADPSRTTPRDLIIGIKGHVVSVDPTTGRENWRTNLKAGLSSEHVTLAIVDPGTIAAGSSGELFALDRSLGRIRWNAKLKRLGLGLVSLGSNELAVAKAIQQAQAAAAAAG